MTGNNPGNIRRVQGQTWQGEITPSPWRSGFATFVTLDYGFRALMVLLKNYIGAGYNSVNKIINRWAPPSENDTRAYINFVSSYTGFPELQTLQATPAVLQKLAAAIAEVEHSGALTNNDLLALQRGAALVTTGAAQTAGGGYILPLVAVLIAGGAILGRRSRT